MHFSARQQSKRKCHSKKHAEANLSDITLAHLAILTMLR
jgi:hypothetical protein